MIVYMYMYAYRQSVDCRNMMKSKEDIIRGAGILHFISNDSLKKADQVVHTREK